MEGLEYYDEERMLELINQYGDFDPNAGFDGAIDDDDFYFEGELNDNELESKIQNYTRLECIDFKQYEPLTAFYSIKYLGWSKFFDRFLKIHLIISDEFYTFCVVNKEYLVNNYNDLKKDNTLILKYSGIRQNYKGEDYPFLTLLYKLPKK